MFAFDLRLDKPYEDLGVWWQSTRPSRKINGRIKYSPENGISLECSDWLVEIGYESWPPPCTLHGELNTFGPTTLFHAAGSSLLLQKIANQTFSASGLLIGSHVTSLDQRYGGVMLKLTQLNDWFSPGPFSYQYDSDGSSHLVDYQFQNEPDELPPVYIPAIDSYLSIGCVSNQTGSGHFATLSHDVYLLVHAKSERSITELLTIALDLEILITLLSGFPSPIYSLALIPQGTTERKREHLYLYNQSLRRFGTKLFPRTDMPANYETVQSTFAEVLNRWFATARKFDTVIQLLRSTLFTPSSPYIENRFLSISQALEGYCRIAANESHLSRGEFSKIKKTMRGQIPAGISDECKELMKNRIGRMNDYSFRDRLLSLFRRHEWLKFILARGKHDVLTGVDITLFAKQFVDSRNSLTHIEAGPSTLGLVEYRMFALGRDLLCHMLLSEAGVQTKDNYVRIREEWGSVLWWCGDVLA